jgi:beta-glucanase (GH16 family)
MLAVLVLSGAVMCGCGGGGGASSGTTTTTPPPVTAATPTITTTAALGGASIATIADSTSGATIYFTLDGSTPTTSSQVYQTPFLISSSMTVNAIAAASGDTTSAVATKAFTPGIASGTLVWSDEFANSGSTNAEPNPLVWTWESGGGGWGNSELEYYCPWGSNTSPCNSASPNSYVAPGGGLNIVAEQPSTGVYTSARMKTQGLFSFMYGRIEAKIWVPESQGMWPAFWALGNNITTEPWPACGELDIMEHIDGSNPGGLGYDWTQATIHGNNISVGTPYHPSGFTAAAWHTYGMIWKQGQVQFYVDDPTNPYETFNSTTYGTSWPFDQGPQFILLNMAVGGSWPGNPDSTTTFPQDYKVDYVRIYSN